MNKILMINLVTSLKERCIHIKIVVTQYYSFLHRWPDPKCTEVSKTLLTELAGL